MTVTPSAFAYVNALLKDTPHSWTGSRGLNAVIPYSYQIDNPNHSVTADPTVSINNASGLKTVDPLAPNMNEVNYLHQAMLAWSSVANVTYQDVGTSMGADTPLTFRMLGIAADAPRHWGQDGLAINSNGSSVFPSGGTLNNFAGSQIMHSDVVYDRLQDNAGPIDMANGKDGMHGTFGYNTVLHEMGHATFDFRDLNSNAGMDPNPQADASLTIMSYHNSNAAGGYGYDVTPMIYDIASAQYLYGANASTNAMNNVYRYVPGAQGFDGHTITGHPYQWTIWDPSGVDTLDAHQYTAGGVTLDLRGGVDTKGTAANIFDDRPYMSVIGNERIAIAFDTLPGAAHGIVNIEAAIGTKNADMLYDGWGNNTLFGGGGNDHFFSTHGYDTLYGGTTVAGGADAGGTDSYYINNYSGTNLQESVIHTGAVSVAHIYTHMDATDGTDADHYGLNALQYGVHEFIFNDHAGTTADVYDSNGSYRFGNADDTYVVMKGSAQLGLNDFGNDTFVFDLGMDSIHASNCSIAACGTIDGNDALYFGSTTSRVVGSFGLYEHVASLNGGKGVWHIGDNDYLVMGDQDKQAKIYDLSQFTHDATNSQILNLKAAAVPLLTINLTADNHIADGVIHLPFGISLQDYMAGDQTTFAHSNLHFDTAHMNGWDVSGHLA